MNEDWKDFLHFTRSERNGMFVLTAICIVLLITPTIYRHLLKGTVKTEFSEFQNQIDSFYQGNYVESLETQIIQLFPFNPNEALKEDFQKLGLSRKVASTIDNYRNKGGRFYKKEDFKKIYGITPEDYERLKDYIVLEDKKIRESEKNIFAEEPEMVIELFEFDPNTVSKDDLKRLGISSKAANIMMNYRKKGGTFRKREDLSKIYGITEDDFERLFSYIKIDETQFAKVFASNESKEIPKSFDNIENPKTEENYSNLKVAINSSTPEDWQQLKGIGPMYSKWICGFRDKLGGFVSIEQIAETYNLPDSTFQAIKPFLVLSGPVYKINLNTASAKEFASHPYFSWKQANTIVKYRKQHGNFTSIDELENIKNLNEKALQKIKPYLEI